MASLATVWVDVLPDYRKTGKALEQGAAKVNAEPAGRAVGKRFSAGFSASLKGLGLAVGAVVSARALSGLNNLAQTASDMNETVSKTRNIFGKSAGEIEKFASTASTSLGLSKQAALAGAAQFGNFFDQIGLGTSASVKMSKGLVQLSADLGSFNNADPAQVMEAFQSATNGEYDSLQRFIPTVNAANVETEALRQTHKKSKDDLTAADKATALYAIAQRDAGKAVGDFARTQGGLANQQRTLKGQFTDLKASIGQALLPAFEALAQTMTTSVMPTLQTMADEYMPRISAVIAEKVAPALKTFVLGVRATVLAFQEGDVTSDGFVGVMEKIGVTLRDLRGSFANLTTGSGQSSVQLASLADSASRLAPVVQELLDQMPSLGSTLSVAATGMDFLADNADTLARFMPVLVAGFVAYKVAQAAANVAQAVAVPTKVAEVIVNRQLVKSNRELIASRVQLTVATAGGTAVENGATVSKARGTIATIASRAATIAANIATKVWTVSTVALGVAMRIAMGPVGIAITVIAAAAAGIIYLYKHNETARRIIDRVWKDIQRIISFAWNNIVKPIFGFMVAYYTALFKAAQAAARWIADSWAKVRGAASGAWEFVKNVFANFQRGNQALADGFRRAAQGIGDAFGRLREAAKAPVNFIIGTVYNQGVRGFWGKIKGALGIKGFDLPYIPTLAKGGKFSTPTAIVGEGDTNRPEYVIPTDPRHRKRALALYEDLGGQLLEGGGVIGWLKDPIGSFKNLASGPLDKLKNVGGGKFGEMLASMPRIMIDALKKKVSDWWSGGEGGLGGNALGGTGVAYMMRVLRAVFPGLPLNSGYRPGSITATGNRSYHASGRAVDVPPRMDVFNWIRSHFGSKSKELIYSPAGNRQIKNGKGHYYTGVTRQMHFNHVHWAYANGGVINEPVWGVGRSGRTYSFGERGPETVIPGVAGGSGGGVTLVNQGVITTHDVEDWFASTAKNVKRRRPGVF